MDVKKTDVNFSSKKAAHYEEFARRAVFGYDQLFLMVLSLLAVDHNESANVLVVGCGTGMELTTFGNLMPNGSITGVDPSEEMIKISKAKLNEYQLNDRITLHHGYVESLPEKEKYDFSTLIFVLRFIPETKDKISLLNNISKRLKPGAKLVIIDQYGDPREKDFIIMSESWKNFMKFGGSPPDLIDKIARQAAEQNLINEQELIKLLSETGFEKINQFYNSFIHGGWVVQKIEKR